MSQTDYENALKLKETGNNFFRQKNYKEALKNYTKTFIHIGINPELGISELFSGKKQQTNPLVNLYFFEKTIFMHNITHNKYINITSQTK